MVMNPARAARDAVSAKRLLAAAGVATFLGEYAWAARPSAGSVPVGSQIVVTGLPGVSRQQFQSDGTLWLPVGGAIPIGRSGAPVVLCGAGAFNGSGQMTLTNALPYTPAGNVLVYLFAGNGLAAGLYTATFSAANLFQLAGNPVTTAGPYAGGIAEVTLFSFTLPGGILGPGGFLRYHHHWTLRNTADNKTMQVKLAANALTTLVLTTNSGYRGNNVIANRGSESVQIASGVGAGSQLIGTQSGAPVQMSVNTGVDVTVSVTAQLANAADYMILESALFEATPGN